MTRVERSQKKRNTMKRRIAFNIYTITLAIIIGILLGIVAGNIYYKKYAEDHPYEPTVYDAIERVTNLNKTKENNNGR